MTEAIGLGAVAMQEICICADDFGLGAGVNTAVVDLAERGKISATSGMVRRSAWVDGARMLRRIAPEQLEVGLHLDLTRPSQGDGAEPGLAGLLLQTYTRTVFVEGLRSDVCDQLTRFEDAMGCAPAFIDGHRHVHQFPVVREVLVEEISRRYPTSPPWLRSTEPGGPLRREGLKARMIHALGGSTLQQQARSRGIPCSRGLLGVYDFDGDAGAYRSRLDYWLRTARTGDVLMCHPSAAPFAADPHANARLQEYEELGAIDFPWHSGTGSVRPVTLTRLLRAGLAMSKQRGISTRSAS
ncbi:ChbG/HpnK family deacetylase [Variovorax sp. J22G21]|uniref:ChbG/HpnK family deacetylase n=1 Tax=Variovorax fucosicus TaxID=3053517 RepID=UPI0025787774|nr:MULTISPECIES: ChbG/HpnK family deacetylase [unclassified Variovorax]MDM0038965.1 ChbG/HpnK family deacetylase [Variovorax sp. J22R193]MDM0063741.1 ChbG/HpnK family deacetylase [Variovorax sp. J22G21]